MAAPSSAATAISRSAYIEGGTGYDAENVYKSKSLASAILRLNPENTLYAHHNPNLFIRFIQNTLTTPYYPVKGNKFEAEFKYSFNHHLTLAQPTDSNATAVYQ